MPNPITRLHAVALPLLRDNFDTDELIPVSENTRVSTSGWGDGLFAAKRYLNGTGRKPDPGFILNQAPYDRAAIIVSGGNFGCGSSRESAVWALRDYGFRVVVAISFNETFKRNCIVNGLAPLAIARADAEILAAEIMRDPQAGVSVDLESGLLRHGTPAQPGEAFAFQLDPFYRALLTTGSTEEDMLGALQADIDRRRDALIGAGPWLRSGGLRQARPG
jgi:3-isopropylmalate/(R)-2-methylmalate dehydratase small subunit